MRLRIGLAVVGSVVLTQAACGADDGVFRTSTGVRVIPVSADVFEVIPGPGNEANQLWCGAGEYARRTLGAKPSDHVYVVSGAGPATTMKAPMSAQFSLKPPSQVADAKGHDPKLGPFRVGVVRVGQNKFVGDASSNCRRREDLAAF